MIRRWIAARKLKQRALKVCDGVIAIANNEMLVHGVYVTQKVVNEQLKKQGAICGGKAACFIGSMYLANGDMPLKPTLLPGQSSRVWDGIFSEHRDSYMKSRPALRLAYDACNQAAKNIVDLKWSEWSHHDPNIGPYTGWAEFFFEEILGNHMGFAEEEVTDDGENLRHPYERTRDEMIRVVSDAKVLINTGAVGA